MYDRTALMKVDVLAGYTCVRVLQSCEGISFSACGGMRHSYVQSMNSMTTWCPVVMMRGE